MLLPLKGPEGINQKVTHSLKKTVSLMQEIKN